MAGLCAIYGDERLARAMHARLDRATEAVQTLATPAGYALAGEHLARVGEVCCAFDGVLFNSGTLRAALGDDDVRPANDAELVARLFEKHGTDTFARLDGAFTAVVVDDDALWVVRDPLGEKPVYLTVTDGRVRVASEIKAFFADPSFRAEPDLRSLRRLLVFSFVPGPPSMFRGVDELLPGHCVRLSPDRCGEQESYWDLEEAIADEDQETMARRVEERIVGAVRVRLGSASRVGAFLSGGVDSSAVVAVLRELGATVHTFSAGFGPHVHNELRFARSVARHCGTIHHDVHIEPPDFIDLLPTIIRTLDDPICDCIVVPNYLMAREAAADVDLLFNGEGGDPLFGGPKNKFLILHQWYAYLGDVELPRAYLSSYHKLYDYLGAALSDDLDGDAADLEELVRPYLEHSGFSCFLNRLMYINTKLKGGQSILVKVDKLLSANGLTARSPLFDRSLAELAFAVPPDLKRKDDVEKWILKRAVAAKLPHEIVYRKKMGMGVPLNHWFRNTVLRDFAHDLLTSERARTRGYFRAQFVDRLLAGDPPEAMLGQDRTGELVWMLVAVELWHRVFVDNRGEE